MTQVKCTKIELAKYNKKKALFEKYLPTLHLKKMILQTEVFKAQAEIDSAIEKYEKEFAIVEGQAILLTDPSVDAVIDQVQIDEVDIVYENMAGIEVPSLRGLTFKQGETNFMVQPIWVEDLVSMIKKLKRSYQRVELAKKKKEILEHELRVISTRVNLFEKRLIPETTKIISKIKVFLSDLDLQAVASAKISKNKIIERKEQVVV